MTLRKVYNYVVVKYIYFNYSPIELIYILQLLFNLKHNV